MIFFKKTFDNAGEKLHNTHIDSRQAAVNNQEVNKMNNSKLFTQAHALTKATIKAGDNYRVTFAAALKLLYKETTTEEVELLVKEKKGYSFRLLNTKTGETFRAFQKDFKNISFLVGSLLTAQMEASDDLITSIEILNEVVGDSTKTRVEVEVENVKIGDLIDGVPVLNFGQVYAKKGKKVAYAYFK